MRALEPELHELLRSQRVEQRGHEEALALQRSQRRDAHAQRCAALHAEAAAEVSAEQERLQREQRARGTERLRELLAGHEAALAQAEAAAAADLAAERARHDAEWRRVEAEADRAADEVGAFGAPGRESTVVVAFHASVVGFVR